MSTSLPHPTLDKLELGHGPHTARSHHEAWLHVLLVTLGTRARSSFTPLPTSVKLPCPGEQPPKSPRARPCKDPICSVPAGPLPRGCWGCPLACMLTSWQSWLSLACSHLHHGCISAGLQRPRAFEDRQGLPTSALGCTASLNFTSSLTLSVWPCLEMGPLQM